MPTQDREMTVYTLKHLTKLPSGKAGSFLHRAAGKIVAIQATVSFTPDGKPNFAWDKNRRMISPFYVSLEQATEKAKKIASRRLRNLRKMTLLLEEAERNPQVVEQDGP